jgi:molecular chaperone DnaK (HSP70)
VPYQLGVDVGTSYSAAAVANEGEARMLPLGNRTPVTPSVVSVRSDGTLAVGEVAEQLAAANPRLAAREFKRLVGSGSGARLHGRPARPEWLMAQIAGWIAERATGRLGEPPAGVVVCHPATWWTAKIDLLRAAVEARGLGPVRTITEPEAAAVAYAAAQRVDDGRIVVVYDLGGGTFDVALLRREGQGFTIVGRPEGLEHLGGVDFDAAVRAHVNRALRGALDRFDATDPSLAPALARLRADCVAAKEALSADSTVVIPVLLPGLKEEVRLTRTEFEAMIRPAFVDTLGATRRALRSSGVAPADIDAVLLVGGSSRIPLVAQMVSAELGRPIAVDAHPKHLVALGAALAGVTGIPQREVTRSSVAPIVVPAPTPQRAEATPNEPSAAETPDIRSADTPPVGDQPVSDVRAFASASDMNPSVSGASPSSRRPQLALVATAAVLALVVAVMAWALFVG